jgi:hypothetical protein
VTIFVWARWRSLQEFQWSFFEQPSIW